MSEREFSGVDSEALMMAVRSELAFSNEPACTSASYCAESRAQGDGPLGRAYRSGQSPVLGTRNRQYSGRSNCPSGAAADRLSIP